MNLPMFIFAIIEFSHLSKFIKDFHFYRAHIILFMILSFFWNEKYQLLLILKTAPDL